MKPVYTLANGKRVELIYISQTGYSSGDSETWDMQSDDRLTDEEIDFIIECEKPSAGYGASIKTRITHVGDKQHRVRVTSWVSCD